MRVKRKVAAEAEESNPPLSAFAARRQRIYVGGGSKANSASKVLGENSDSGAVLGDIDAIDGAEDLEYDDLEDAKPAPSRPPSSSSDGSGLVGDEDDAESQSPSSSTSPQLSDTARILSTFRPDETNISYDDADGLHLRLGPGEIIVIVGQFDLTVVSGAISLLGATISSALLTHRVYIPTTHSLPPIRCIPKGDGPWEPAELEIGACKSGLRRLKTISPLYARIWNEKSGSGRRSFEPLYDTAGHEGRYRQSRLLEWPRGWKSHIELLTDHTTTPLPVVLVCGPKASGKSTFARILINRLLTRPTEAGPSQHQSRGVAFLDLDPGQPEFSTPGQLSLVHLSAPVFGPPFTHPVVPGPGNNRLVRAHAIEALSPQLDPAHFEACAADLVKHYRRHLRSIPLTINYSSWLTAQGLVLLARLVTSLSPTNIVYTSEAGPSQILEYLAEPTLAARVKVLPAQSTHTQSRTSAQSRAMQAISYFHLVAPKNGHLQWDATPVTRIKPWFVPYRGEQAIISAMIVLGRRVPAAHVLRVFDGKTVAVVVADPEVAIRDNNVPPDPSRSHCIGHALVRGVNATTETLELLTAIDRDSIELFREEGSNIVLVGGKTDVPSWGYFEESRSSRCDPAKVPLERGKHLPWVQRLSPGDINLDFGRSSEII